MDVSTPEVYNAFVAELATFCREQIAKGHGTREGPTINTRSADATAVLCRCESTVLMTRSRPALGLTLSLVPTLAVAFTQTSTLTLNPNLEP